MDGCANRDHETLRGFDGLALVGSRPYRPRALLYIRPRLPRLGKIRGDKPSKAGRPRPTGPMISI